MEAAQLGIVDAVEGSEERLIEEIRALRTNDNVRMAAAEEDQSPTKSGLQRLADQIDEDGENTRDFLYEQLEDMEARLRRLGETANYVKVNAEGDPIDDDDDDDDEEALLGEGSFGKLVRMKHIPEDALRAVKVIKISKAKSDGCSIETLLSEARILDMLTHESIVRYWGHLFCGTVNNPTLQKCKLLHTRTLEPCLANMTVISDCAALFGYSWYSRQPSPLPPPS